jgi:hypothetical protein
LPKPIKGKPWFNPDQRCGGGSAGHWRNHQTMGDAPTKKAAELPALGALRRLIGAQILGGEQPAIEKIGVPYSRFEERRQ